MFLDRSAWVAAGSCFSLVALLAIRHVINTRTALAQRLCSITSTSVQTTFSTQSTAVALSKNAKSYTRPANRKHDTATREARLEGRGLLVQFGFASALYLISLGSLVYQTSMPPRQRTAPVPQALGTLISGWAYLFQATTSMVLILVSALRATELQKEDRDGAISL